MYEQACNQLVRANLALNGGDPDDAAALTYSADIIFDELGVVSLPRVPWSLRSPQAGVSDSTGAMAR